MKTTWLSVVCCLPLICGCSALSVAPTANSRFTSETVRLGMTKEQFVEQFGRPFKESFFRDEHGVLHETLYYKEFMGSWYAVNTLFRFEDSVLVAQEQGDEERLYSTAASKIDRNRAIPFRIGSFRTVPHQNRSFRKDGEKGSGLPPCRASAR